MCIKMKLEEILTESNNLDLDKKQYEKEGIFIYENPKDFIKALNELEELYLSSTSKGVGLNE